MQEDFEAAAQEATKLPSGVTNDEKLQLYGLFKQAKEGDCSTCKLDLNGLDMTDAAG